MPTKDIFEVIIIIARPAAGKSEIIHFLKQTHLEDRKNRFHVGQLEEIDDFPMLWTWFEEDAILAEMGKPRLHTDAAGYFLDDSLWNLLIRRISLEYAKRHRDDTLLQEPTTTLIEFSRGRQQGGYREAFQHLSKEILIKAAILYIDVSFQESLRKNRARFNPDRPDSILEHGLTDDKMETLYRETDWHDLASGVSGYLTIQGIRIPYVVFENEDDVTTHPGKALEKRLASTLNQLWDLNIHRS